MAVLAERDAAPGLAAAAPRRLRYHSLDALRAGAMLLGVLLHSAISFMVWAPEDFWPAEDVRRSEWFDLFVFAVHTFRMQVFFVMAGFFAVLLLRRRGTSGFLRHRLGRIVLPLALGMLTIAPLLRAEWIFGQARLADPGADGRLAIAQSWAGGQFIGTLHLFHMWFLWYLLLFYGLMLLGAPLFRRAIEAGWPDRLLRRVLESRAKAVWLAIPTTLLMLPMDSWMVDTPFGFLPEVRMVLYYGFFFAFGCLLYRQPELLAACARGWRAHLLIAALVAFPVSGALVGLGPAGRGVLGGGWKLPANTTYALFTWLMVFGLIGFFRARWANPSAAMRYISDASYWLYLTHLPVIIALQIAWQDWPAPAVAKFTAITLLSTGVLLLVYELGVRYTAIGAMLNGPKRRGAPIGS